MGRIGFLPAILGLIALAPRQASLSDAEVRAQVDRSNLVVVAQEYASSFCPNADTDQSDPQAYDRWIEYVAAHVKSGTAFGDDYPKLAAPVYGQIHNNVYADCAKHIHDPAELDKRDNESPEKVGRELFAMFVPDEAATRARASAAILAAAYAVAY